jgi:putative tryptophan/tyrosine transport system substrate-binding protein
LKSPQTSKPPSRTFLGNRPDAIWCGDTPVNIGRRDRIAAFAARKLVPTIAGLRQFAEAGGLMTRGTNLAEAERRAAAYVYKILNGAKPGKLPIEQPTRFEFVISLKTAATLGLNIPQHLLPTADEVIR